MEFYAHTIQDKNGNTLPESQWQTLADHLNGTAELAQSFALPKLKESAFVLGLLHDVGKCQPTFQKRLRGGKAKIDHAVCGAKVALEIFEKKRFLGELYAYPIIGHHSGLPDKGAKGLDNSDESAFLVRIQKDCEDFSAYKDFVDAPDVSKLEDELKDFFDESDPEKRAEVEQRYEFLIRYLYSCLTDADFLDTESFVTGHKREVLNVNFSLCEKQLKDRFDSFQTKTPLQKARNSLKKQARENLEKSSGHMFLLDMPTGSGKTLCSMQLALKQLQKYGRKRIIYVIPYTSIIEQTAATLHSIFPELTILQHHSNFEFESEDEAETDGEISASEKLKKSTENWDAPVVITTNVQFFESIYSNRVSKLRKLHNIANSVIIFDEIHTLPIKNFAFCMKAVKRFAVDFESDVFFLTATMPDFAKLCRDFADIDIRMQDLLPDKRDYSIFDKCTFEFLDKVDVLSKINKDKSTLVVCNSKKGAQKLFNAFNGEKFYLSTYMTPTHRLEVIQKIRSALESGKKIVVFSTSLIEAGVDLDFEEVFRELAGVDNILQTAGRCNREGLRKKEESKVFVFSTDLRPSSEVDLKALVTRGLIAEFGVENLAKKECVTTYFARVFKVDKHAIKKSEKSVSLRMNFKTTAKDFEMIDANTQSVVIPCEEIMQEIAKLKAVGFANRRKLQRYSASVTTYELKKLLQAGVVKEYNGVILLESPNLYSKTTGLDLESVPGSDFYY